MPAGQQRDEQPLEHRVLADDHALELVERVLEAGARVLDDLSGPRHQRSSESGSRAPGSAATVLLRAVAAVAAVVVGRDWSGVGVADWTGVERRAGRVGRGESRGHAEGERAAGGREGEELRMAASLPTDSSDPHKRR